MERKGAEWPDLESRDWSAANCHLSVTNASICMALHDARKEKPHHGAAFLRRLERHGGSSYWVCLYAAMRDTAVYQGA